MTIVLKSDSLEGCVLMSSEYQPVSMNPSNPSDIKSVNPHMNPICNATLVGLRSIRGWDMVLQQDGSPRKLWWSIFIL